MKTSRRSELLSLPPLEEGARGEAGGIALELRDGILRAQSLASTAQSQTSEAFEFKWAKRESFEASHVRERTRRWLIARYGEIEGANWWSESGESPVVLDAGCGAAYSAVELLASRLHRLRYVGMDISPAVDVAAQRFSERGLPGAFIQADLMQPPFADATVDVVFSEGVLHHTTRQNWR